MSFSRARCFQIQVGGLLTDVWTGRIASFGISLAGSGQVFTSDFLIEIWAKLYNYQPRKKKSLCVLKLLCLGNTRCNRPCITTKV